MNHFKISNLISAATIFCMIACNNSEKKPEVMEASLKEDNITYTGDSTTMNGFVVYDENIQGTRPGVLVVHEWWGLNDYSKMRARELAKLGYIAFAVDMFGNGQQADNPELAGKLAMPFYQDQQMARERFNAAVVKLKTFAQTDTSKIAAIGYCFGGTQVLNMARLGEDLDGVVSFHGSLAGIPAIKDNLRAAILVCHGGDDKFVTQAEVDQFKKEMDSIGAKYLFRVYENATHAFTNPNATETGQKFNIPIAYNAAADTASWTEMKTFLSSLFP